MTVYTLSLIVIFLSVALPSKLHLRTMSNALSSSTIDIKTPILFCFLGLLAALRASDIGNDTSGYIDLYERINRTEIKELSFYSERFEMGFIWLNKLLSYISTNPQTILIATSAFAYYWYYKFIKKYSPLVGVSILLFFFARFHDSSMNIVRQVVATGFILWSYMELKKGKDLRFFLLMLLAFYMHKSSIVFLLSWFFVHVPFKSSYIKYFLVAWAITLTTGNALINLIFSTGLVQSYFEDSAYFDEGKIAPAIILVMDALVLLFYLLTKSHKTNRELATDITWMLMATAIFQTLGVFFAIMSRVAWYFRLFQLIAIPYALSQLKKDNYVITTVIISALYISYYLVTSILRPDWNYVYPYSTCFNH